MKPWVWDPPSKMLARPALCCRQIALLAVLVRRLRSEATFWPHGLRQAGVEPGSIRSLDELLMDLLGLSPGSRRKACPVAAPGGGSWVRRSRRAVTRWASCASRRTRSTCSGCWDPLFPRWKYHTGKQPPGMAIVYHRLPRGFSHEHEGVAITSGKRYLFCGSFS
jgi:hypothetical protein